MVRWSGVYSFHWAPILTFASRRERALEFIEEHLRVAAFLDGPDEFGVAVGRSSMRIIVRRGGFELLLGSPDLSAEDAQELLAAIIKAFSPRRVHISGARSLWTAELGTPATAVASSTAASMFDKPSGVEPVDFSVLADAATPGARLQIEYGVVDGDELRLRLTQTIRGRLRAGEMPPLRDLPSDLPESSLFADVSWVTIGHDTYDGGEGVDGVCEYVANRVALVQHESDALVAAALRKLTAEGGSSGEFSRGVS